MSLRHAILGILEFKPVHGYELKRVLEEGIANFWPVKLPAIYPSLHRLEEEGLVAHRTEATLEGRPDRKVYTLTEAGRTELARWRRLPPDGLPQLKSPLLLKLLFAKAENLPDAVEWVTKELEWLHARASEVRAEMVDPRAFSSVVIQFMRESAVAHFELQIELLQDLRERLRQVLRERGPQHEPEGEV